MLHGSGWRVWLTQRQILATLWDGQQGQLSVCLPSSHFSARVQIFIDLTTCSVTACSSANEYVISPGSSLDGKIMCWNIVRGQIFLFYNRGILHYSYYYYCFIIEEYPSILTQKWSFNPRFFFFVYSKYCESNSSLFLSSSSSWSLASLYLIDILETLVWPPLSSLLRTFFFLRWVAVWFPLAFFEKCD